MTKQVQNIQWWWHTNLIRGLWCCYCCWYNI